MVVAPHPSALVAPAESYDQDTVTFDRNHPPQPPPLQLADGGPAAEAEPGRAAHAAVTTIIAQSARTTFMPASWRSAPRRRGRCSLRRRHQVGAPRRRAARPAERRRRSRGRRERRPEARAEPRRAAWRRPERSHAL